MAGNYAVGTSLSDQADVQLDIDAAWREEYWGVDEMKERVRQLLEDEQHDWASMTPQEAIEVLREAIGDDVDVVGGEVGDIISTVVSDCGHMFQMDSVF
jgi:hypothetical protein